MVLTKVVGLAQVGEAIGLGAQSHVAFVGGDGKTTAMFGIGASLDRVVMTATTEMAATGIATATDGGFTVWVGGSLAELAGDVATRNRLVAWRATDSTRGLGYSPATCDQLSLVVDHVLVKADHAGGGPIAAPGPLEPVIPSTATHVVAMIGADALGRCIGDQCRRPMRIAALAGCGPFDRLTPERAARVLLSNRGGRKGVPPSARFVVAVTNVDDAVLATVDELHQNLSTIPLVAIEAAESVDVLGNKSKGESA